MDTKVGHKDWGTCCLTTAYLSESVSLLHCRPHSSTLLEKLHQEKNVFNYVVFLDEWQLLNVFSELVVGRVQSQQGKAGLRKVQLVFPYGEITVWLHACAFCAYHSCVCVCVCVLTYFPYTYEFMVWSFLCCSRILNTTLFESWEIIGPYPSWWLFNSLLLVLQVLHVIWSYLIAGIAYKALVRGKVSGM